MHFIKQCWHLLDFIDNDQFAFIKQFTFFTKQGWANLKCHAHITFQQIINCSFRKKHFQQRAFSRLP